MTTPIETDALVAYGQGPKGDPGDATQADIDAAIAALKGSVSASNNTLKKIEDNLALKAPLASPHFTGSPTATTQAEGVNDTTIATTFYADRAATNAAAVVRSYADTLIAANDAMVFKGVIDCSANPNYPAADRGHTYKVSVAGKIGGASGINVEVGDTLLCITDGTAAGNQATVGTAWTIVQANLDGAVIGPASAVSGNAASFSGTSGKLIADSGKAFPSGVIVGTTDSQTLTNKTLTNAIVGTQTVNDNSTKAASTAYVDGDWTSYTPTLSSVTGTLGGGNTASGMYRQRGKCVEFQASAVIGVSGNGTGAFLSISLPATAGAGDFFCLAKDISSGEAYLGHIQAAAASISLQKMADAGGGIVNSHTYRVSGLYRAA